MKTVAAYFTEFYDVIYGEPIFMSPAAIQRIGEICIGLGTAYMELREISRQAGRYAWNIKPKLHKLMHFPELCEIMNPRFVMCYSDEAQLGTSTEVWKRCMSGRYQEFAQRSVLAKRLLGLLLRFEP